ncbi:MAG: hypothetical protein ACT4P4_06860 [Betaproteobacteria bacterium]
MRRLLAAGAVVLALAGLYLAADEALTPEAAAMLEEPKRGLADEDNAWFMLVGLAARPEENALEFGREWTAAAREVRSPQALEAFERRFARCSPWRWHATTSPFRR